jgi:hypothetical protein
MMPRKPDLMAECPHQRCNESSGAEIDARAHENYFIQTGYCPEGIRGDRVMF